MLLRRMLVLLVCGAGLGATTAVADTVGPITVPTSLPTVSTSILPTVNPTSLLPTVAPSLAPSVAPSVASTLAPTAVPTVPQGGPVATPAPAPGPTTAPQGTTTAPRSQPAGGLGASPPSAPGSVPVLGPLGGPLPQLAELLDTPLGPAPPIAGLALLALSTALALRRRLRQLERDRTLDTAKVGFLKIASHELRTPLTVIRGYVAMAADGTLGQLPGRLHSVIPTLESEVGQLERLVEQMLLAARLDERLLVLDRKRADLRQVIEEALKALPDAPQHNVVLELDAAAVPVRVDRQRMADVLGNLVDNAVKYSPAGGEVVVRVERRWGRATVSVTDTGLGIGARDVPLLFTRFGRIVTPENSHIFGSGLGLYLVRELVRLHEGQVRATSVLGQGSTFTVELPLDLPLWARLAPARSRRPAARATQAAG